MHVATIFDADPVAPMYLLWILLGFGYRHIFLFGKQPLENGRQASRTKPGEQGTCPCVQRHKTKNRTTYTGAERAEQGEASEASEAPPFTHKETHDGEPSKMYGGRASRAKRGE